MTAHASLRVLASCVLVFAAGGLWSCSSEAAKPATPPTPTPPLPGASVTDAPDKVENHPELKIEVLKPPTGTDELKYGQRAKFLYTGTLASGKVFDSNRFNSTGDPNPGREFGKPTEFQIMDGALIKGWWLGVVGMKVGERRRITVPATLGYGQGGGGTVPGDATLFFDVELTEVIKQP